MKNCFLLHKIIKNNKRIYILRQKIIEKILYLQSKKSTIFSLQKTGLIKLIKEKFGLLN